VGAGGHCKPMRGVKKSEQRLEAEYKSNSVAAINLYAKKVCTC